MGEPKKTMEISKVVKNSNQQIRISLKVWKEDYFVDIRIFHLSGEFYKAGYKGLTVRADLIPELIKGLTAAKKALP